MNLNPSAASITSGTSFGLSTLVAVHGDDGLPAFRQKKPTGCGGKPESPGPQALSPWDEEGFPHHLGQSER